MWSLTIIFTLSMPSLSTIKNIYKEWPFSVSCEGKSVVQQPDHADLEKPVKKKSYWESYCWVQLKIWHTSRCIVHLTVNCAARCSFCCTAAWGCLLPPGTPANTSCTITIMQYGGYSEIPQAGMARTCSYHRAHPCQWAVSVCLCSGNTT